MARSSVNLRPPAVRVAAETRVRFGVAVGVGLGTRMGSGVALGAGLGTRVGLGVAMGVGLGARVALGVTVGVGLGTRVGVGVAVGATEDSSISAGGFAASIPLLRMRIKRCFRIKKMEPSNWMREVERVDSIPALFSVV